MPRINKVGHVVLNVKDVETSVKFYTEALGMEVMRLRESSAAFLSLAPSTTTLPSSSPRGR